MRYVKQELDPDLIVGRGETCVMRPRSLQVASDQRKTSAGDSTTDDVDVIEIHLSPGHIKFANVRAREQKDEGAKAPQPEIWRDPLYPFPFDVPHQ